MRLDGLLETPQRVLAVCAHPDDESFGLGAVISTLVDQGARVDLVCLTHGEASTLGSPTVDLARARGGELAAAANELGITTVHRFDHPDGHLSSVDLAVLTAAVQPLAEHVDLLLVFDEGGITGHPDHIHATATALAVADVLELPVLAWTLDRHVADILNTEFDARFVGRAEGEIHVRLPVDRRRQDAAIRCHDSQFTGNPVPERRIALTGNTEPLRYLRRAHPTTHDTEDFTR